MAAKKSSESAKKGGAKKLPKTSAAAEKKAPAAKPAKPAKASSSQTPSKAPAKKRAASAAAPAASAPASKKAASKKSLYTPEQVYRMIEEEAYYIAERSGFQRNSQDCWVEAEAVVQTRIG